MPGDIPLMPTEPGATHGAKIPCAVPSVESGADGLAIWTSGGGLRPAPPSSVEPSGIPVCPTVCAAPMLVGDDAEAAGAVDEPPVAAQVPDAVPVMPPPSNSAPVPDIPMLAAPFPEHAVAPPAVGARGEAPEMVGLTPGVASSVAPSGMPVGPTGAVGPMPSGEVGLSGIGVLAPTCAATEVLARSMAANASIADRAIVASSSLRALPEASVICGRRETGAPAERSAERAGLAETDRQPDIGDRGLRRGQQDLGVLDAPLVVIAMRRQAEGLLERTAEIVGAQPHETRQRRERNVVGEMLLDIARGNSLLPRREPAARRRLPARCVGAEAHDLMRQYDTECVEIRAIVGGCSFDETLQLERSAPQRLILEQQPWHECRGCSVCVGMRRDDRGIEIDEDHGCKHARIMPLAIFMSGWHEGEFAFEIAHLRLGQTVDEALACPPHALLVHDQQVPRTAKTERDAAIRDDPNDLGRHAIPDGETPTRAVGRQDLHSGIHVDNSPSVGGPVATADTTERGTSARHRNRVCRSQMTLVIQIFARRQGAHQHVPPLMLMTLHRPSDPRWCPPPRTVTLFSSRPRAPFYGGSFRARHRFAEHIPWYRSAPVGHYRPAAVPAISAEVDQGLEHFQEKWRPVFRPKMRPT